MEIEETLQLSHSDRAQQLASVCMCHVLHIYEWDPEIMIAQVQLVFESRDGVSKQMV